MSESRRFPRTIATSAAALLVAVIALNVLPRLVSLPSLDVPSLGLPDLPDVPGWVRKLLEIKNWVLIGIAVFVAIGSAVEEIQKDRRRDA